MGVKNKTGEKTSYQKRFILNMTQRQWDTAAHKIRAFKEENTNQ